MSDFEKRAREAAIDIWEKKGCATSLTEFARSLVLFQQWLAAFKIASRWGRAYAKRELRKPMECEHPKACWQDEIVPSPTTAGVTIRLGYYCSACRRDQELREVLQESLQANTLLVERCQEIYGDPVNDNCYVAAVKAIKRANALLASPVARLNRWMDDCGWP